MKKHTEVEFHLPANVETLKAALSSLPDDAVVAMQITQELTGYGYGEHMAPRGQLTVSYEEEV